MFPLGEGSYLQGLQGACGGDRDLQSTSALLEGVIKLPHDSVLSWSPLVWFPGRTDTVFLSEEQTIQFSTEGFLSFSVTRNVTFSVAFPKLSVGGEIGKLLDAGFIVVF